MRSHILGGISVVIKLDELQGNWFDALGVNPFLFDYLASSASFG